MIKWLSKVPNDTFNVYGNGKFHKYIKSLKSLIDNKSRYTLHNIKKDREYSLGTIFRLPPQSTKKLDKRFLGSV